LCKSSNLNHGFDYVNDSGAFQSETELDPILQILQTLHDSRIEIYKLFAENQKIHSSAFWSRAFLLAALLFTLSSLGLFLAIVSVVTVTGF
jgi:hypothetical protein